MELATPLDGVILVKESNPNVKYVEREIIKAFSVVKSQRNVMVSKLLKELDISELIKPHRRIRFSAEFIMKSLIFMKLKGVRFQAQLAIHLRRNKEDARNLGFDQKSPNQRTFSYYTNHILDDETNEVIAFIARRIEDIAEKFGITLDSEVIRTKKHKKSSNDKTVYNRKMKGLREACKFTKRNVYPHIRMDIGNNAKFNRKCQLDLLLNTANVNQFLENNSNTLKNKFKNGEIDKEYPLADAPLYHIKKYGKGREGIRALQNMSMKMYEKVWDHAKSTNQFKDRKLDVAIDYTDWLYYGNKNDFMVLERKYEAGTTSCYRFATINIVEPGMRFTLLALPVGKFDSKKEIVSKLLDYASKKISIRRVYSDRGFFSIEVINMLKQQGFSFIMPAIRNSEIKRLCESMPAPFIIEDYKMGKSSKYTEFNLFLVSGEKENVMPFATNLKIKENEADLVKNLAGEYRKRWGIETSYRDMCDGFRPKTTSKNYTVRMFYFLFSVMFYNIWILIKLLISISLFGKIVEKSLIPGKMFGEILFQLDFKST